MLRIRKVTRRRTSDCRTLWDGRHLGDPSAVRRTDDRYQTNAPSSATRFNSASAGYGSGSSSLSAVPLPGVPAEV